MHIIFPFLYKKRDYEHIHYGSAVEVTFRFVSIFSCLPQTRLPISLCLMLEDILLNFSGAYLLNNYEFLEQARRYSLARKL